MNEEVIYEGKYAEFLETLSQPAEGDGRNLAAAITGDDSAGYFRKVLENTVSVFMPDRVARRNQFLKTAREVAEAYLIDVVFSSHDHHVTATYTLDCESDFHCLKGIISQADSLSFQIDQGKVLLSLRF